MESARIKADILDIINDKPLENDQVYEVERELSKICADDISVCAEVSALLQNLWKISGKDVNKFRPFDSALHTSIGQVKTEDVPEVVERGNIREQMALISNVPNTGCDFLWSLIFNAEILSEALGEPTRTTFKKEARKRLERVAFLTGVTLEFLYTKQELFYNKQYFTWHIRPTRKGQSNRMSILFLACVLDLTWFLLSEVNAFMKTHFVIWNRRGCVS